MTIKTLPLFLMLITASFNASTQIYKSIDKHGNAVFTDKPSTNQPSEPVTLKPTTSLPSPPNIPSSHSAAEPTRHGKPGYNVFSISNPANDSTVRNNGSFTIKVSLQPNLNRGHRVRFFIDGQAVAGPQRTLSHQVENMNRGTHLIRAEVVNHSGKVIQTTESTVHVQRTIYRPPAP
ncbi:DUF4124 domain-containing protein [Endozoicomonas gorgoniicola]|uniref:DUF4124 domain-containing protein n=1 Tax=Endozoicomonas gorgoniicola TaxID=1234144 RepID=A0ABT3N2H2_9GAMM|nr:DUF4124 domain-containing protein [Endozoicomonas gorgoniicola]MCW7555828.1 DUF4124 domain-containing protein [Endozoicomonas gorgoniicola]